MSFYRTLRVTSSLCRAVCTASNKHFSICTPGQTRTCAGALLCVVPFFSRRVEGAVHMSVQEDGRFLAVSSSTRKLTVFKRVADGDSLQGSSALSFQRCFEQEVFRKQLHSAASRGYQLQTAWYGERSLQRSAAGPFFFTAFRVAGRKVTGFCKLVLVERFKQGFSFPGLCLVRPSARVLMRVVRFSFGSRDSTPRGSRLSAPCRPHCFQVCGRQP